MCPYCGQSTQLPGTIVGCTAHVGVYDDTPAPKGMKCGHVFYDGGSCDKPYQHKGRCK